MTEEALIERLEDIEWEDLEVKEARSDVPKNTWETVSAFSNTRGGWLVFGVKKNGKDYQITGVQNAEKIEQDFTTVLRGDKFNQPIVPDCRKYDFPEGTVLAFYIPLSDRKPVYFNQPKNTFIRTASGDQRASQEEIDAFFRDQAFGTQTSGTAPGTSLDDLDEHSYEQYREYLTHFNPSHPYNRLGKEEFLNKLRISSDGALTYGGLLCLGKEEAVQKVFPSFRVDHLEIPGTSYSNARPRYNYRIDERENLWEYFFGIFERLRRQLERPFQLTEEGFASENHPHAEALREGLVNMLMHSDYFSPACPRVRVFEDRVEFFNPGALPKTLEKLMEEDISLPRNPIIAKFFRVVGLAENAGYGFDKMIEGWKGYSGTAPEFHQGQDHTTVTFYFEAKEEEGVGRKWGENEEKVGRKLGDSEKAILELIKEDPFITIPDLSERIGISTRSIEMNIQKLKEKGLLERSGLKGGYWKVIGPEDP